MQYVTTMGAVWRLSEKNFRKLIRDIKADGDIDLDRYGKMITGDLQELRDLQEYPEQFGDDKEDE